MKPGRYAVSARREALVAAKSFPVDGETTVELRLEEGFAVRGHVFDSSGRPIAGAVVQAQAWFRDPFGGPCGTNFNLTNGLGVVFTP